MTKLYPPFPRVPHVAPGENFYGYLRRLTFENGFSSIRLMLQEMGLHNLGPTSDSESWALLLEVTGLPPAELNEMRWRVPGSSSLSDEVQILRQQVRKTFLSLTKMRFCPACLSERHILLEFWSLLYVTCCPKHGTTLVDTCDQCGAPFRYRSRTKPWECTCGNPIANVDSSPADEPSRRIANLLAGCLRNPKNFGLDSPVEDAKTPRQFRQLKLNDLMVCIEHFGTIATTGSDAFSDPPYLRKTLRPSASVLGDKTPFEALNRHAAAALNILDSWPQAHHDLLDDLRGRNPAAAQPSRLTRMFATEMGNKALATPSGINGQAIPVLAAAIEEYLELPHIMYRKGERRSASIEAPSRGKVAKAPLWPASAAAMKLNGVIDPSTMIAWDHPDLVPPTALNSVRWQRAYYDPNVVAEFSQRIAGLLKPEVREGMTPFFHLKQSKLLPFPYSRQAALIDIFANRLDIYGDAPNLQSIYVDLEQATTLSVRSEVSNLLENDAFVLAFRLNTISKFVFKNFEAATREQMKSLTDNFIVRECSEKRSKSSSQRNILYSFRDIFPIFVNRYGLSSELYNLL